MAVTRRRVPALLFPYGHTDAAAQIALWAGFALGYEAVRGLVVGTRETAFANARAVIRLEQRLGGLPELRVQRAVIDSGGTLLHLVDWTYWLAQFGVLLLGIVWVYYRDRDRYLRLRDTVILANVLGMLGYLLFPVAPPRLLPAYGFVDTLAQSEVLNHGTGIVRFLANPYAAMPSLHTADALALGLALAEGVRAPARRALFLAWPAWVVFALLATGNHFWLDAAAGVALVLAARAVVDRARKRPEAAKTAGRTNVKQSEPGR